MVEVLNGLLKAKQLDLSTIFSVGRVLASRGFQVRSMGRGSDTILKKDVWDRDELAAVFDVFHDPVKRSQLLAYIENGKQIDALPVKALVSHPCFASDRKAFSTTFEWYVGALLVQEFGAFSSAYGICVRDIRDSGSQGNAGDFDVLATLGTMDIFYVECKTGRGGFNQGAVLKMVSRAAALHCVGSVMLLGRKVPLEQIAKGLAEIKYPYFNQTMRPRFFEVPSINGSKVCRWRNSFFVCADETGGDVQKRLQTVLRLLAAEKIEDHSVGETDEDWYSNHGYRVTFPEL